MVASPANMDTTKKTYLALGDSYTIGESVLASEQFPVQTVKNLRNLQNNFSEPDIIATTGWTTADLLHYLDANPPQHTYTIVSLLIGVNNQYQGRSLEEYKDEFDRLLKRSIAYAANIPAHVFVLSIPDYSVTPFGQQRDTLAIAKEIDEFNAANKMIALQARVHYIDITPISRQSKNNASLLANDGLHPSGYQYQRWSELLVPAILDAIK